MSAAEFVMISSYSHRQWSPTSANGGHQWYARATATDRAKSDPNWLERNASFLYSAMPRVASRPPTWGDNGRIWFPRCQRAEENVSGLLSGELSSDKTPSWEDQNVQTKREGWITP
jgi:hypothetical protein